MKNSRFSGTTIIDIVNGLACQVKSLKEMLAVQSTKLSCNETNILSTHDLEVRHNTQKMSETTRRDALTDRDLRCDLERQYGKSSWSKKLIDQVLKDRILVPDISWAIA